jgi:hypothetical protein
MPVTSHVLNASESREAWPIRSGSSIEAGSPGLRGRPERGRRSAHPIWIRLTTSAPTHILSGGPKLSRNGVWVSYP